MGDRAIEIDHGRGRHDAQPVIERGDARPVGIGGPARRKSFVVSYRAQGRQHFHTLGQFGPMTVHEAKTRALEVLAAVRRGEDPAGDRSDYRKAPTMADLFERFMREHARPRKKATSVVTDERIWQLHILPQIGKRKIAEVERADVSRLHAEMAETPYQANRLLAVLSKAFNLAEVWGWRPDGSNRFESMRKPTSATVTSRSVATMIW